MSATYAPCGETLVSLEGLGVTLLKVVRLNGRILVFLRDGPHARYRGLQLDEDDVRRLHEAFGKALVPR